MNKQELRDQIARLEAQLAEARAALFAGDAPDDGESDKDGFIECVIGGDGHIGDMLLRGFSGYWLQGYKHFRDKDGNALGWLCVDMYEQDEMSLDAENARHLEAVKAVKDRLSGGWSALKLKNGYHFVDAKAAQKAWAVGTKRWGTGFGDGDCDYGDWDWALQHAVLGEYVYG